MLFLQVCRQSWSKEMRESVCSCNQTWAKSQWKPESKVWEGVSEWELSVRAQHPPFGLYLKGEWPGTTARSWRQRLLAVGKRWQGVANRWGRPTQGFGRPPMWALWLTARAQVLPNGNKLWTLGCRAKLCLERSSKVFFKGFQCSENIFGFFVKTEKVLENSNIFGFQ